MSTFDKLYIDGAFTPSDSTETIDVIDSVTEDVMATIRPSRTVNAITETGRPCGATTTPATPFTRAGRTNGAKCANVSACPARMALVAFKNIANRYAKKNPLVYLNLCL